MIKYFEIKAVYSKSNKTRKRQIVAKDKESAIEKMRVEGYIDPFEVIEYIEPPTENQLEYAKALKISVPPDASKADVSALIDRAKFDYSDPNPELVEYANEIGLIFSDYIGKKGLYNTIFDNLYQEDRMAFFIFCVYRWLSDDRKGNLNKHTHRDLFYEFASHQMQNDKFRISVNEYRGEDIRFFGKIKYSDGREVYGGDTNTIAYKTCANFLKERLGLRNKTTTKLQSKQVASRKTTGKTPSKNDTAKGCIYMVIIVIMIIFVIYVWNSPSREPEKSDIQTNDTITKDSLIIENGKYRIITPSGRREK